MLRVIQFGQERPKGLTKLGVEKCVILDECTIIRGQQESPGMPNGCILVLELVRGLEHDPNLEQVSIPYDCFFWRQIVSLHERSFRSILSVDAVNLLTRRM